MSTTTRPTHPRLCDRVQVHWNSEAFEVRALLREFDFSDEENLSPKEWKC